MTHQDYFNMLPVHIQKQFLENMKKQNEDAQEYLLKKDNTHKFIDYAMSWSDTEEGSQYWSRINKLFRKGRLPAAEDFEKIYKEFPEYSKRDQVINNYQIF